MTVSIIIPYFQRERGVLRRAIESVARQTYADWRVIVVDDASPLPAAEDVAALDDAVRARVAIVKQPNGGPGAARNAGLDAVEDADHVAFLDSDDEWAPDHLQRAIEAMAAFEADCYFASISGSDEFAYHGQIADAAARWPSKQLQTDPLVVEIHALADAMLTDWSFMHVSCLVLRSDLAERVRFEPALRLAAEDVVFFQDCVQRAERVVLSAGAGAERGLGDNLFHGLDNQADAYLRQQFSVLRAFALLQKRGGHSSDARRILARRKDMARRHMLWGQTARAKAGLGLQWSGLADWVVRDPALIGLAAKMVKWRVAGGDTLDAGLV